MGISYVLGVAICLATAVASTLPTSVQGRFMLQVSGTTNYTCIGGKPVFDGAKLVYSGEDTGYVYYTPPEPGMENGRVGYSVGVLQHNGVYYLDSLKNVTTYGPSGAVVGGRWPVALMSVNATRCDYVTRSNAKCELPACLLTDAAGTRHTAV
ncbi:hypothetical protein N2152v2_003251 [Parachlorella kessleri]